MSFFIVTVLESSKISSPQKGFLRALKISFYGKKILPWLEPYLLSWAINQVLTIQHHKANRGHIKPSRK